MSPAEPLDWLIEFIALSGVTKRTITGGTAASCFVMAMVILWLQRGVFREQKWAKYFGWAFLTFTVMYLFRWLNLSAWALGMKNTWSQELYLIFQITEQLVALLGSSMNNLFFLATALALLLNAPDRRRHFLQLALVASLGTIICRNFTQWPWHRLPDAVLSFACLSLVGWALYTRISPRRRLVLSMVALTGGVAHGILEIIYASVPMSREFLPDAFTQSVAQHLRDLNRALGSPEIEITPAYAYDATLFGVALFLKFFLFAGAFFLLLRTIMMLHPVTLYDVLSQIEAGKVEYLHGDGIVKAIGKSLRADMAEVCLLLPGTQTESVVWWRWHTDELPRVESILRFEITPLPQAKNSVVGKVLATNRPVKCVNIQKLRDEDSYLQKAPGMKSLLAIPIRRHNTAIGCLNVEWTDTAAYTDTAFQLLENLGTFLAPTAQARRITEALAQCSNRLPTLKRFPAHGRRSVLVKAVDIVHDILSPRATGLSLDLGFQPHWEIRSDEFDSKDSRTGDELHTTREFSDVTAEINARFLCADSSSTGHNGDPLKPVALEVDEIKVGTLILLPHPADKLIAPQRRSILENLRPLSSLVADAILDVIKSDFSSRLNRLQLELNDTEVRSPKKWFEITEETVRSIGLLWMVTRSPGSEQRLGKDAAISIVEAIEKREVTPDLERDGMRLYTIEPPTDGTHHVLALDFSASGDDLWLGISRQGFGKELKFPSPWKIFLERLTEAANTALVRITATRELQQAHIAQAQYQGLTTSLVTAGTMSHQLNNFAKSFATGMATLAEAVGDDLRANEDLTELIYSLQRSTSELRSILKPMMSTTAFNEEQPCDLTKAIEKSSKLYKSWLQQANIEMILPEKERNHPLTIDVPFHVAALAISNLISNSISVIEHEGEIRIETIELDREIQCMISDTGPGIPANVASRVFDLGYTTKPESGGWGLYLTRRSLIENAAAIALSSTGSDGTTFTISFPKA